ncbi:MAG TPA: bifunctional YncE family protein/alkaline phosphatase family protein [Terriglobia bacterium]|nr:bifunctional YncE family protein/alkaline phosphatase family protein [Terriglobia bacterium]
MMRPSWRGVLCGVLLGVSSLLLLVGKNVSAAQNVTPTELPSGWKITPAGRIVNLAGDMPLRVLPLRDGRRVLVLTGGYHDHSLSLVDIAGGKVVKTLELGKVWAGLAIDPSGSNLFVSGGGPLLKRFGEHPANTSLDPMVQESLSLPVLRVRLQKNQLTPRPGLAIAGLAEKDRFIAGVAVARDGTLYVVNNQHDTVYKLNSEDGAVLASAQVGYRPFAIALSPDSRMVAVSNWGDQSVSLLDPATLKEIARVPVGAQPSDLAYASDGRLFVANAGSNSVSVIAGGKVIETIKTSLDPRDPVGSTPDALAVSPNGKFLFVANADNNDVAMIDVARKADSRVLGFIPTGWYPSAIGVTPDGRQLLVATGKGMGSRPTVPVVSKDPNKSPDPSTPYDYVGDILSGHLEIIEVPRASALKAYTRQAFANVPRPQQGVSAEDERQGREAFRHIKHVLYIIRENRTYDQVFGDLGRGNGDPNLVLFGKQITPNAHKLANQTVILDNLYVNGEVSEDGHQWSDAAYATNFTEKAWPSSYSSRGEPKADERLTASPAGYLWDNCRRHGISYISYGEFTHFVSDPGHAPTYNSVSGLEGHFSKAWLGLRRGRDTDKAKVFIDDLHKAEQTGQWWQFMVMSLPEDHTRGLAAGAFTPRATVGSNDLALGRMVEAISHSRFWPETAIFVIEDDAQNGPDHVDVHRTVGLVISPYARHEFVDSTHYTTASMVRTMEMILGLPAMSQYDRAATPMYRSFQNHENLWAFAAVRPHTDLEARNPKTGPGAVASARLDFSDIDRADPNALNRILWDALRPGQPMPAPVHSAALLQGQ